MIEPLDFPQLLRASYRALRRHNLSDREGRIAQTVIDLSFGIDEPNLQLSRASELADLTGMSKGNAHVMVQQLKRGRALQVSENGLVFTFLPPSPEYQWIYLPRVNVHLADERERAIIWAAKGAKQADFYFHQQDAGKEFNDVLAMERMRASLIAYHDAATSRLMGSGSNIFSAMDRLPKPAPAAPPAKGSEGLSRPLGTAGGGTYSPAESWADPESSRVNSAPAAGESRGEGGSQFGNPVPNSGTPGSQIGNSPLKTLNALSVSMCCTSPEDVQNTEPLSTLNVGFPNREPAVLAPDAGEEDIMKFLRKMMGQSAMAKWGGWWRLRIRDDRRSVLDAVWNCELRMREGKPPRNPGSWTKDQFNRFHQARARLDSTAGEAGTTTNN